MLIELPSGVRYLPDFLLPDLRTFIEVKGPHMERISKVNELAAEVEIAAVITLIGFPPLTRRTTEFFHDPYMQWRDPLGYDTRFMQCPHCMAWQWIRPQLSRACRVCVEPHHGLLAKTGEIPFIPAQPEPFRRPTFSKWAAALCPGFR
jgi:hypothetical protein